MSRSCSCHPGSPEACGRRIPSSRAVFLCVPWLILAGVLRTAPAQDDSLVFPPHSEVHGKTLMQWSADWWTWVVGIPTPTNPLLDATGELADVGQSGPVFFLVGTWGSSVASRKCQVPFGKDLFFPILNGIAGNGPGETLTCDEWRRAVEGWISNTCELWCELDDGPVAANLFDYREPSPCFAPCLPADNLFMPEAYCQTESVSDGFWVMLKPLPEGVHKLHFGGKICGGEPFQLDVTYEITVSPQVSPPHSEVNGKTLMDWSAEWWKWALGIPKPTNPLLDTTGEFAHVGQSGPVFFLVGTWGSEVVSRECQVPTGKNLFFPILNSIAGNGPGETLTCDEWRRENVEWMDKTCELWCELDDSPVVANLFDYREASPCFEPCLPEDNLFRPQAYCLTEAVSDGYWLMLEPLPEGVHNLRFGGKVCGGEPFQLDITYEITVVDQQYPPHSEVHGKTLMEWSAEWWTWVLGIAKPENPTSDPTGEFAHVGQGGPVFFLVGTFSAAPTSRRCNVPSGKSLFFPLVNMCYGSGPGENVSCDEWLRSCEKVIDNTCELFCEVDGTAIPGNLFDHREQSSCFTVMCPTDNIFMPDPFCLRDAATDGYWVMLKPLPDGVHIVHFGSKICGGEPGEQDHTYEITMGPVDRPPTFRRGDVNSDATADLTDAIAILTDLFIGGGDPIVCRDAADIQDDGVVDISDPISILNWLFLGSCCPAWPTTDNCGSDPTDDDLPECTSTCS